MPELNLPFFTITESEFTRITQLFQQWRKRSSNPLKGIDPEKVTLALINSIEYLLSDRITDGIGQGGWGYSDADYMKLLYGLDAYNPGRESIMTTAVNVLALHDSLMYLDNSGIRINGTRPKALLDSISYDLQGYLDSRWDKNKGYGGILNVDHENSYVITPQYRHTAWLFHLWRLLPMYHERMRLTAIHLLSEFDAVDWRKQKVATAVAAFSAFSILENDPLCKSLGAETPHRVKHLKYVLEGQIESQYSQDLSGWTSGNTLQGGRQLYTLFVCAEMAPLYSRPDAVLTSRMCSALEATMDPKWGSTDSCGVPLEPGGPSNISASTLCVSAFIRKPKLSREEADFLSRVLDFAIGKLAEDQKVIKGTFSWALSYFVRDLLHLLNVDRR